MQHLIAIGDSIYPLWLTRRADGYHLLRDGGHDHRVTLGEYRTGRVRLSVDGVTVDAFVVVDGDDIHVHVDGSTFHCRFVDPVRHRAKHHGASADDTVVAPMPGTVVAIAAGPGQVVATGDILMVIESMKLETAIKAWRDGIVETVHVAVGKSFERSTALVSLVAQGDP
jgi:acetyl/propionyl-CoA carboxylase alpha subunit